MIGYNILFVLKKESIDWIEEFSLFLKMII